MQNIDTEHAVLGLLMSPGADTALAWELAEEMFTTDETQGTYCAIMKQLEEGYPIDIVSVYQRLIAMYGTQDKHNAGAINLSAWTNSFHRPENLRFVVNDLRRITRLSKMQTVLGEAVRLVNDETCDPSHVERMIRLALDNELSLYTPSDNDHTTLSDELSQLWQQIQDNLQPETRHYRCPTGLSKVDERAPLPETGLAVVAGGTSHGKSALAGLIAYSVAHGMEEHKEQPAREGRPVFYLSMEMTSLGITARTLAQSADTGLSADEYLRVPIPDADRRQQVWDAIGALQQGVGERFHFSQTRRLTLGTIKERIRAFVKDYGVRLVVIDYLGLIRPDAEYKFSTQERFMGDCARDLKNLADELGILVIALSQLNRDILTVRPTLNRLRDSGQIAEAADWVMLIWRPEAVHWDVSYDGQWKSLPTRGTGLVMVVKNREGQLYEEPVRWDARRTLFYEDWHYFLSILRRKPKAEGEDASTEAKQSAEERPFQQQQLELFD